MAVLTHKAIQDTDRAVVSASLWSIFSLGTYCDGLTNAACKVAAKARALCRPFLSFSKWTQVSTAYRQEGKAEAHTASCHS